MKEKDRKAILVIDMQKDNVGKFCQDIISNIQRLLDEARKKDLKVIFAVDTRFEDDSLFDRLKMRKHAIKGTEGWKVIDELSPAEKDIIVEKPRLSAFFASNLDFVLREYDISTLVITGIRTEGCVLKTILDAFELGYDVILAVDCVASPSKENHEDALNILDLLKIKKLKVDEIICNL